MRGRRLPKVCGKASVALNAGVEEEPSVQDWSHGLGRMPVEVKRRNRCIVSAEKAIGGQGPRVGSPVYWGCRPGGGYQLVAHAR